LNTIVWGRNLIPLVVCLAPGGMERKGWIRVLGRAPNLPIPAAIAEAGVKMSNSAREAKTSVHVSSVAKQITDDAGRISLAIGVSGRSNAHRPSSTAWSVQPPWPDLRHWPGRGAGSWRAGRR